MSVNVKEVTELSMLSLEGGNLPSEAVVKEQLEALIKELELPESLDIEIELSRENIMVLREDEVEPSLERNQILVNAPKTQAGCFVVPKTV